MGNRSDPESVSAGLFRRPPPPRWIFERHLLPENVCFEVFGTPTSQAPAAAGACDFFFEPGEKSPAVLDNSCVRSHPDLQDATFALAVEAEENKAAEISVAAKSDDATVVMGLFVDLVLEKSDRVCIDTTRTSDEENEFSNFLSRCGGLC